VNKNQKEALRVVPRTTAQNPFDPPSPGLFGEDYEDAHNVEEEDEQPGQDAPPTHGEGDHSTRQEDKQVDLEDVLREKEYERAKARAIRELVGGKILAPRDNPRRNLKDHLR
jgi:hypothetical protein